MLKRTIASVLGFLFLFTLIITPKPAQAQTDASARSITVIPPSFELYANPGESVSEKIKVRNDSTAKTTYTIEVEDFKAVGEEGSVNLVEDQSTTTYSLAKWVFPEPKTFSLEPQQEKQIPFSINVPKNAEPGGHYASILVKIGGDSAGLAGGSGAAVSSRVGSLLLLRVSGNIKEDASVETFATSKKYYQGSPIDFELRVKNNGNNHIKPTGSIVITNIFGHKVAEIQLDGRNVLPDAIRKINTQWKFSALLANRYTATLVATYGQQNKPLSASTSFIIFPRSLVIVVGALILILVLMFLGRKKVRRILHALTR